MSYILSAKEFGPLIADQFTNQEQIPCCIGVKAIDRIVFWGQVTDCDTGEPIQGALVKAFFVRNPNTPVERVFALCHTFSGCDGYYMISLPQRVNGTDCNGVTECLNLAATNGVVRVMAIGTTCLDCLDPNELDPCICPPPPGP